MTIPTYKKAIYILGPLTFQSPVVMFLVCAMVSAQHMSELGSMLFTFAFTYTYYRLWLVIRRNHAELDRACVQMFFKRGADTQ